jgi:hypothetical protein
MMDDERVGRISEVVKSCLEQAGASGLTPREAFVMAASLMGTILSRGLLVHDNVEAHMECAQRMIRVAYQADRARLDIPQTIQ